jgi:hypothetical protein
MSKGCSHTRFGTRNSWFLEPYNAERRLCPDYNEFRCDKAALRLGARPLWATWWLQTTTRPDHLRSMALSADAMKKLGALRKSPGGTAQSGAWGIGPIGLTGALGAMPPGPIPISPMTDRLLWRGFRQKLGARGAAKAELTEVNHTPMLRTVTGRSPDDHLAVAATLDARIGTADLVGLEATRPFTGRTSSASANGANGSWRRCSRRRRN